MNAVPYGQVVKGCAWTVAESVGGSPSQLGRMAGCRAVLVLWYQVPGRTRFRPLCYQDQLRQSPGLPGTVLVALGALPV